MLPLIFGGIANMIFTKTPIYKKWKKPIDNYKTTKSGKRYLGDNKTWIGFLSMIIFVAVFQVAFGLLNDILSISHMNDFYAVYDNSIIYNLIVGAASGFIYMLFELPNSFIKRRIDIPSGKTVGGFRGVLFFVVDQIDSLIGVMFVLFLVSNITVWKYFGYVAVGGITHILINLILKSLKIRRNI